MLQPSVGQPETKARRGITLQQGSERGQNQGMGTPSSMAGMGIQQWTGFMPRLVLALLPWPGTRDTGRWKSKGTLMWQQDRVTRQGDHRQSGLLHNRSPQR